MIPDGRYQRQAGEHLNPHTYQDIHTIADHVYWSGDHGPHRGNRRSEEAGGGHAHVGAMIYLGGHWPEKYRNRIFMHNVHGFRSNTDIVEETIGAAASLPPQNSHSPSRQAADTHQSDDHGNRPWHRLLRSQQLHSALPPTNEADAPRLSTNPYRRLKNKTYLRSPPLLRRRPIRRKNPQHRPKFYLCFLPLPPRI